MLFRKHISAVKSLLKHKLSAALKRKCLNLDGKIAILNYANEHPKMNRRKLAEYFPLVKTTISNISKNSKKLAKELQVFQGKLQKTSPWKISCNQ